MSTTLETAQKFYQATLDYLTLCPLVSLRLAFAQAADELTLDDGVLTQPLPPYVGDFVGEPAQAFVREVLASLRGDTVPAPPPPLDTVRCPPPADDSGEVLAWEVAS